MDVDGQVATRRRLEQLAWVLDSAIPIPGLKFRIGLDALIGLVPGVGDIIGMFLSSYIVTQAAQLGASRAILMRMAFNVAIEGVVGMVPLFGDIVDAAWKANRRNVALLNDYLEQPRKTQRASGAFVFVLVVVLIGVLVGLGALAYYILRWLFTLGS